MYDDAERCEKQQGYEVGAVLWISGQDALDMEAASDEEVRPTESIIEVGTEDWSRNSKQVFAETCEEHDFD